MNFSVENYPWQDLVWQHLHRNNKTLPHAILLYGREGIGKYDFAKNFSMSLLCSKKSVEGYPCTVCSSCKWFKDMSHPDFRILTTEQDVESDEENITIKKSKKKTQITVAQIRELTSFLGLTSHRSEGLRVILIHPAEALNLSSANALLKMLEEPSEGVLFILIAHQLNRLLPTIISRCQKINMPIPQEDLALSWLDAQGVKNAKLQLAYFEGSPIKVINEHLQFEQLMEIPRFLALGSKLEPHLAVPVILANSSESGIIAIQKWIYDIASMRLSHQIRFFVQYTKALQELAEKVNLSRLFGLQKKAEEMRKFALHPLNQELQMESFLLEYTKIFTSKK